METKKLKFPKGFLWGASTSAHQVEGGLRNNWTEWEKENAERLAEEAGKKWKKWQQEKFPEMFEKENYISGRACDHYNRYEEDFEIAKELGHNAHRFSIEWSRIEPEEGKFDEKEIEHYRKVILALKERGMEPFVTLWHWTEPVWFNEKGGWINKKSQKYFLRFVEKIVSELKNDVKFWIVVNEPNVGLGFGYLTGAQPPAKKNLITFLKAYFNLLSVYKKSYALIHQIDEAANVGLAHSYYVYESKLFKPLDKFISAIPTYFSNYFTKKANGYEDFIGCNYYTRLLISPDMFRELLDEKRNDLGWEIHPEGIYKVLIGLKKYDLPVYITENGIADANDRKREKFIKDHLVQVYKAISEGVDVRGYLHWSLLDNYEFPEVRGFWPRFGLIEMDYKTLERKIRSSALEYAKICKNNEIEVD
ncbi:MAG: beta-glucosidase [Parcubacteria group bacterium Athens0714_25]|nr:MAG: beta-glucosidase [Parcubacteria group bacterium Athens0714_25]